ncbi:protein FAM210B, mitochondrial isoform X1 [Lemur catta]|uniref:protein FAM210B, mitochondrial isoform X1 n=1 Tax=Lemur catta TaxID=9447 RepID=UPI001E268755|nr:protein FAM210B, mitochondrial isoform X1 [Lemur catta]
MAGLLALLGPAGRVGARVRPRATWLLGAAALPCAPPPPTLALLRPGPDVRLLRTARGDCRGHQPPEPSTSGVPEAPHLGKPRKRSSQDPSRGTETMGSSVSSTEEKKQSKTQQLKKVFQEYGAVAVSVHIGISLISLSIFYMVVSSGVDMSAVLLKLGFKESLVPSKVAAGTSTFVVAYAIHKLFAPVRISITLVSVPLIVRYFRKVGFFKPPVAKP